MNSENHPQVVWIPEKSQIWCRGTVLQSDAVRSEMEIEYCDSMGGKNIVTVSSTTVHPVDPTHMLNLDNICLMNNMHEAPLLDLLRRRFSNNEIYTLTGNILISLNPYQAIPGMYDQALKYLHMHGAATQAQSVDTVVDDDNERLAPHVFSTANRALAYMMTSLYSSAASDTVDSTLSVEDRAGNQSVVISGESGAGKTENSKYVMSFLIQANKEMRRPMIAKRSSLGMKITRFTEGLISVLLESSVVLEAFGNAKTVRNDNSSRFGKYIKLMYSDPSRSDEPRYGTAAVPELVAAVTDTFLLEKSRLVSIGKGERNYHIFYQLLRGLAKEDCTLCAELGLDRPVAEYATLVQGGCSVIHSETDDATDFCATLSALHTLHCSDEEIRQLWALLACLLHLSSLQCVDANTVGGTNDEPAHITAPTIAIEKLASLLGFECMELLRCLTTQELIIMKRASIHIKVLSSADVTRNVLALVKWMYNRLFGWLVRKINLSHSRLSTTASASEHARFIGILDIFGFEILGVNSFEQLCINLTNERLQQQFNESVFVSEQEMYRAEGLQWDNIKYRDNQHVIDLISGAKPQGLLLILEEHCMLNRGVPDDAALLASYDQTHEPIGVAARAASAYCKPRFKTAGFVVRHFAGEVTYMVEGFLSKNNDAMQEDLTNLLARSENIFLRNALNIGEPDLEGPGYIPFDLPDIDPESPSAEPQPQDLNKRSARRILTPKKHAAAVTVSQQFRGQLDSLMRTLRATQPHYIKCVKPNTSKAAKLFEAGLVMEQLRYSGVLEVVRIRREGFPIRLSFGDFYRKYQIFTNGKPAAEYPGPDNCRDEAQAKWCCQQIAAWVLQPGQYQLGHTLIFLRDDGLEVLATATRDYLAMKATTLQAAFRCRRAYLEYRLTLLSVVICQSIVRKFCCVRRLRRAKKACVSIRCALRRLVLDRKCLQRQELKRYCATRIQSLVRGKQGRKQLQALRAAATVLQLFVSSRLRALTQRNIFLEFKFAVLKVQLLVRNWLRRKREKLKTRCAVRIQSALRMHRERMGFVLCKFAALRIQAIARGRAARLQYRLLVAESQRSAAAVHIQKCVRRRRCQLRYMLVLIAATTLQAFIRRSIARQRFVHARASASLIQSAVRRRQAQLIFGLKLFSVVIVQSAARRLFGKKQVQLRRSARLALQSVLQMWVARRRYQFTRYRIVLAQSVVRQKIARLRYSESCFALVMLQSFARMVLARKQRAFVYVAVLVVQSVGRMIVAKEQYRLHRFCIIKIQSVIRAHLQKNYYHYCRFALVTLQSWVRGVLGTLSFRKAVGSIILIETHWRRHQAARRYKQQMAAIAALQRNMRLFVSHLRFRQELMRFHEMLMCEELEDPGHGQLTRSEMELAVKTSLRGRPTLSIIRNPWLEYCTACHSAILGGDPRLLALLRPNYRDMFEVSVKGHSSAHYLAERPSLPILRAVVVMLDAYRYASTAPLRALDDDDEGESWNGKGRESGRISFSLKQTINNSAAKDTLKQGWLRKKRGGMMWQRRYMVLTEDYIIYYKNEQSLHLPKFAIPLEGLTVHRLPGNGDLAFEINSPSMPEKKTIFGSSNKKAMSFMADSEQDLQEWLLPLKVIAGVEENLRPSGSDAAPIVYANMVIRQLWVSQTDRRGNTPLHWLAARMHGYRPNDDAALSRIGDAVRLAAWFIEHGCNVNAQNDQGQTALHICAYEFLASAVGTVGSRELMRCLVLKGADGSKLRDQQGNTALEAIGASAQISKALRTYLGDLFKIRTESAATMRKSEGGGDSTVKLKGYSYLSFYVGKTLIVDEDSWVDPIARFSVYNSKGQLIECVQELLNPVLSSIDREAYAAADPVAAENLPRRQGKYTSLYWGAYWHMRTPLQNLEAGTCVVIEVSDGASEQASAPCYWARYPINFASINCAQDEVLSLSLIQNSQSAVSRRTMLSAPVAPPVVPASASRTSRSSSVGGAEAGLRSRSSELHLDCVLHRRDRNVDAQQLLTSYSNEPYPAAQNIPATGPLQSLPEVSGANRYNGMLDDISVASSDVSSTVPEGHRDHSKYAFVPYRINDQNMQKLEDLFNEGYKKQVAAALPNPEFMSRFGFVGANARKPYAGTGTGIGGEDWQISDSDDEDNEDHRNNDEASVNSTISSGSRSLAYSMSSAGNASIGGASASGSVVSGRYSFSSGISGVGPPIASTETHGVGIGVHNRQIGKYAGVALGVDNRTRLGAIPTAGTLATRDYDSWHERHGPHENPFLEEATPLTTHYRPNTISSERARSTQFRIGGFGVGPPALRNVAAASALPALGAPFAKGEKRDRDEFELLSQSASFTLSQMSNEPMDPAMATRSVEWAPDSRSSSYRPTGSADMQYGSPTQKHHHRHPHTQALQLSRSMGSHLMEGSWPNSQHPGMRTEEFDSPMRPAGAGGSMFDAPLRSIASSQYGERPSDLLQSPPAAHPSTSLLSVSPDRRLLHTSHSPTKAYPSLTCAVHARREKSRSPMHPSTAPHLQGRGRRGMNEFSTGKGEIDDLLAQLDPLALSLNAVHTAKRANTVGRRSADEDGASWISDEDDDLGELDDEDSQGSVTDAGFFDSHLVDAPESRFNEFIRRKKMRIRAEKLIDHNFTKKLFVKKATTKQAQNLISRMESLLQLMDPSSTGFVTWECFARLILAVAPSHLLRSDVMAFMAAQTDNDQNLIDYKEFVISGKVMVIDKQKTSKDNLPVMGWLNRQKLYSGDESTHTWQNHIKWYQSRKSKAVVWLMRRATRSMKHAVLLEEAESFLMHQRRRALALTYLMEVGYVAVNSQGAWKEAKRRLLKRAMHARRVSLNVIAAQSWLANLAKGVVEQLRREDEACLSVEEGSVASSIESVLRAPVKKQADYANFYKLHQYNFMAFTFLKNRAQWALEHSARQDAVQLTLKTYGHRMLMHQLYTESARNWLQMSGERAYQYCMMRDDTMKNLFRRGQHALQLLIRQEAALQWLLNRGQEGLKFVESKADTLVSLIQQGQRTLSFLNVREVAFAALVVRRQKAVVLVARKKEALIFLARQPLGLWANLDKIEATQRWLAERGAQALAHLQKRAKAFQLLQLTAGKASTVMRKQNMAFTDLQQFGQDAKISRFAVQCRTVPQYSQRVREEKARVQQADAKVNKERAAMHKEQRWKAELLDAFNFLATSLTPPVYQGGKKALIGRIGFSRLLRSGKLLGTSRRITYEFFKAVDPGTACFVPFDAVWTWFLHHAQVYENKKLKPQGKELKFTIADILTAEERAQVIVLKRVNSEKIELKSSIDWDALEEKRRRAAWDASSSSSEGEDDEDDIDDETRFSDPRYLKGADIGRMMRYLTKHKQRRDREVLEEEYQESLRAKITASAKLAEAARKSAKTAPFSPTAATSLPREAAADSPAPSEIKPSVDNGEDSDDNSTS